MAKKANPYQRNFDNEYHLDIYNLSPAAGFNYDDVEPISITRDGRIIANGFVDKNDGLELFLSSKSDLTYKIDLNKTTEVHHTVKSDASYLVTGIVTDVISDGFKYYDESIKYYSHIDRNKFKNLNKTSRQLIKTKIFQNPFVFYFTHENGTKYPLPEIKSTWFAPFNYDVYVGPNLTVKNVNDIIVVKSGEFHQAPAAPTTSLIDALYYSSGLTGNIYIETLSIPDHETTTAVSLDFEENTFKIPRSGNNNRSHLGTELNPIGPIGVFKNGVIAMSYRNSLSYNNSGVYNENSLKADLEGRDTCHGYQALTSDIVSGNVRAGAYHYKSAPICLYDTGSTAHSPLLGYAFDGYPIYGPYGYTTAMDSTSTPKLMTPSWRVQPVTNRTNGPGFNGFYPSGYFVEDHEYIDGLGDLDRHNGRTGVTPEYPGGTYAYFTTVTTGSDGVHKPAFPYVVGDKFYGKVEKQNWSGVSILEPVSLVTSSGLDGVNFDVGIFDDYIFGLKYTKRAGLKKETIIYVSPHELSSFSGVTLGTGVYQYPTSSGTSATFSGATFSGIGNSVASGQSNRFLGETVSFSYPTSKNNMFLGSPLSGNMAYLRTDPDTQIIQQLTGAMNLGGTNFHTIYSGYRSGIAGANTKQKNPNFETGYWNGKIPSGVPFKIEVWSFNGGLCGFEDRFKIFPCDSHPAVSGKTVMNYGVFSGTASTEGDAATELRLNAEYQFRKNTSSFLINSGIMEPNKKLIKYSNMLRKSN
jgi:hypothetical protein